jgi:hypothetical protein
VPASADWASQNRYRRNDARRQHLAVPHVPQEAAGVEEPRGGDADERVHGHEIVERPDRRHDAADTGDNLVDPRGVR